MNVYASNLVRALDVAIRERMKYEDEAGYGGPSALLAGWIELRKQLIQEQPVRIIFD